MKLIWRYVPIICTIFLLLAPMEVSGDIAPYERIGHSIEGFFIRQDNISMVSFSVAATVDLPDVKEDFTYVLRSSSNSTISVEAIVPIVFEEDRWEYFEPESIQLFVNGSEYYNFTERDLVFDDVLLNDAELVRDLDHYTGVTINLTFLPFQEIEVRLLCHSYHDPYTESFHYFYTARTARYWNGSIEEGYFEFNYLSKMRSMEFIAPNATLNGTRLTSTMHDWDGNADYEIIVDTGIRYGKNWLPIIINGVCFGIIIILTVSFIIFRKIADKRNLNTE